MRPLIPPRYYFDEDVFQEEQRTVFARVWQLAGFTSDLRNENDYVTAEVGGKSVVVQNFDGELHAFANVCSHRFARLRSEPKGNAWLRCPYHGWIYNKEGIPYSIPARPRFDDLCPEVIQGLALKRYDVESCGGLVFLREQTGGPSLREFLGDSWEIVEAMSLAMGDVADVHVVEVEANWKATVENTLEGYHVGFVHQNTLKKLEKAGDLRMDFRFYGVHSAHRAPVDTAQANQLRKLAGKLGAPFEVDGYVHQLVFPNVTITTTHGIVFGLQHFMPVSPTRTRMTSYIIETRRGPESKLSAGIVNQMSQQSAEFFRDVFAEDKVICEQVQLGLQDAEMPGILSDEEERVSRFQKAYMETMAAVAAPHEALQPA